MKNSCGSLFEGSESMIRLSECRSSNRKAESKRGEIKVMAAFTANIEVIAGVVHGDRSIESNRTFTK